MFDFIGQNQDELKTSFITWTGDNSAHNIWAENNDEITEYTRNITQTLKDSLGPNSDIEVFPVLGNHDTWPVNVQDFSAPYINYPINHLLDSWQDEHWLSEDEISIFAKYGYYSKPMKFHKKGRVIGMNMQACNNLNWWLMDDREDPGQ
jgi:predicted MPP superfamily phosphohydrolase